MPLTSTYKQIYDAIMPAHKIFVVAHPECGDALGSTLAMVAWLDRLGKNYVAYSNKPVPGFLDFLPKSFVVKFDSVEFNMADFDVVIILDSNYNHTGIAEKLYKEIDKYSTTVINIDHHITNAQGEGNISAIDIYSPSTTRMLYDFFVYNNIMISPAIATCLLVGILYDTGNFSNAATNHYALSISADLLSKGAPLGVITDALINDKSIDLLKFWGQILSRLTHDEKTGIVYTVILEEDFNDLDIDNSAGKIANFLNNLNEGKLVMILKEDLAKGIVKVSLRTVHNHVDVAKLAGFFGGGGHTKSSGFAIPGRLVYNDRTQRYRIE